MKRYNNIYQGQNSIEEGMLKIKKITNSYKTMIEIKYFGLRLFLII